MMNAAALLTKGTAFTYLSHCIIAEITFREGASIYPYEKNVTGNYGKSVLFVNFSLGFARVDPTVP